MSNEVEIPVDNSAALWIEPELTGDTGSVTSVIPNRFKAYARILHPAWASDWSSVRWSEVAVALGRKMHAQRQWHVLVGSTDPDTFEGSQWGGAPPERGDLDEEVLQPLCEVLRKHTTDPMHCLFGLWTGWARSAAGIEGEVGGDGKMSEIRLHAASRWVGDMAGPRLDLPGREYVLLAGPLSAALHIRERDDGTGSGISPASPNLMWPADRAWFLASEIDFDSTLVGGSDELIAAIIEADEIEAWPIGPRDLLTADSDSDV